MYSHLIIISINMVCCFCYVGYEIFQGFDATDAVNNTGFVISTEESLHSNSSYDYTNSKTNRTTSTAKPIKFKCPEEERPTSIGAYEVPTQRDLVSFIKKTLMRMFTSYHEKALYFLKDIKEATKATVVIEKKCQGKNKVLYKKCVKRVSNKCELITKALVTSLEKQREDVSSFTEETICNMTAMRADPVHLIKILAMEEASLEFALPGFLRLLSACSGYCSKPYSTKMIKKPLRHMTDQDLVVKHFLTRKNYIQLIKGTNI